MSTAPDLDDIVRVLRSSLPPPFHAYLFGSRASGSAAAMSDWDIGIVGPSTVTGAVIERIREALDGLPTLHSFDVVDLNRTSPGFREAALRSARQLI